MTDNLPFLIAAYGEALKTRKPIYEPSEGGCISFLFDEGSEQRILNDANEAFHICRRLKTAEAREHLLEYARGLALLWQIVVRVADRDRRHSAGIAAVVAD